MLEGSFLKLEKGTHSLEQHVVASVHADSFWALRRVKGHPLLCTRRKAYGPNLTKDFVKNRYLGVMGLAGARHLSVEAPKCSACKLKPPHPSMLCFWNVGIFGSGWAWGPTDLATFLMRKVWNIGL